LDPHPRAPEAQDAPRLRDAAAFPGAAALGSVSLVRVTAADIEGWVAEFVAEGLSPSRIRQIVGVLRGVLDAAVRDRRIVANPAAVRLPRPRPTERRFLSHQQVDQLADACERNRVLVLVLAYTPGCGGRGNRASGAQRRSRPWSAPSCRGGGRDRGKDRRRLAEEPCGARMPLAGFLRPLLEQQIEGKAPDDLVFPAAGGGFLQSSNFRGRCFDAAARAAGLDGLTPHELRHTAASLAIATGASVKAVQSMLAHSTATLTLDLYGHLFPDELDTVADSLDDERARLLADPLRTADSGERVSPLRSVGKTAS
jgi:integrase